MTHLKLLVKQEIMFFSHNSNPTSEGNEEPLQSCLTEQTRTGTTERILTLKRFLHANMMKKH